MKVVFIYEADDISLGGQSSPMSPEEALKALLHWDCPKVPAEREGLPTVAVER